MRLKSKRILMIMMSFIVVVFASISISASTTKNDTEETIKIYFTVEKFTIGQGYIVEPTVLEVKKGERAAVILTDYLKENKIDYYNTGRPDNGFYLSYLEGVNNGEVNIPENIKAMDGFEDSFDPEQNSVPDLGEFDYTSLSGWIYHVNNTSPNVGMSDYHFEDGDIFRLQFTLYGLGSDLGFGFNTDGLKLANKWPLTKRIATINMDKDKYLVTTKVKDAYDNAMKVVVNHDSTQEEVDSALKALPTSIPHKDQDKIDALNDMIDALPLKVTLKDKESINNAKKIYDELDEDGQKQISKDKVDKLNDAIKQLEALEIVKPLPQTKVVKKGNTTSYYKLINNKYYITKKVVKTNKTTKTTNYKIVNKSNKAYKHVTSTKYKKKNVTTYSRNKTFYKDGKVRVDAKYYKDAKTSKMTKKQKYTYKSNGKKQKAVIYNYKNGKYSKRSEYVYNKAGQLKSNKQGKAYRYTTSYNKKGSATKTIRKQYNSKGKIGYKYNIVKKRNSF